MQPIKNILNLFFKKLPAIICLLLAFQNIGISQNNVATDLKNQFETYQINHLQEKIFLHTDKAFYLVGENIWFKAYVVDAFFNRPLSLSKVLYVEIIDKDLKPVLQTKIALDSAMGNGSIAIPPSIVSGNFTLRAYTQWMKNYDVDFFYQQSITIVNTLKDIPLPNDSISKEIDFQFFAEGGNLVDGLTSKIAFKATDKYGNGINCSGIILNNKNDTIANFKSLIFGMGNFVIKPNKNEHYKAVIKLENNTFISKDLPIIYNRGYVMNVTEGNDNQLVITVNSSADVVNAPIYLFAHSHHLIKSIQSATQINGKATFIVDQNDLADGISHFTIFNNDKKPVCERLFFKQPISKLFINNTTEKNEFTFRENIKLAINTIDGSSSTIAANLSTSVFLIDSLQLPTYTDIQSYLLLTSDLKGKIESPSYYLNDKNVDANLAVDNLMLTQGWRRFNWQDILQNKIPYFEFLPEYEGLVLNGKIVDKTTGLPIKNATGYLSIPNRTFQFYNAVSNSEGKVKYSIKSLYGNNQLITQTDGNNNYEINIDNPFSNIFSNTNKLFFNLSSNLKNNLLQRHIAMQVQHTYNMEENRKFIPNKLDTSAFYGSPTFSFNLDAFTRFNTMEEVIKEFVIDVQLRKKDGKSYFRVTDRSLQTLFDNDPLLLIDGVPISDADKIVAFNPLKIKTIDVVSSKYLYGPAIYDGIISFKTYDGDLGGYQLGPNAVALPFDALQQQREFYSPKYETETQQQSRIPDFRNVLYWKPDLKTDIGGKAFVNFYTSDVAGKYAIVTQGITANGKFGSCISTIEVK